MSENPFNSEEIINSIELAVTGLNYLHNNGFLLMLGVVHGNLTPSHIAVTAFGEIIILD